MNITETMIFLPLTTILVIAVICDIRAERIPNWLTLPTMALSMIFYTASNGLEGFLFSFGGVCTGIAVLAVPYLLGGMGAGDAKLMGAVGGILGPKWVFVAFLATALVGGSYSLILLALKDSLKETLQRYWMSLKITMLSRKCTYIPPRDQETMPKLKYAIAICLGTLGSYFLGNFHEILSKLQIL